MQNKLRHSPINLYAVVINNAKKEFFNFIIKTDSRNKAMKIARQRFGVLSDYCAVNVRCQALGVGN
jgi:hypothetical protein